MLSFSIDTGQHHFALPITRCSKSAQKSAVQMCRIGIATVVTETTRLVLSQFKTFLAHEVRIV